MATLLKYENGILVPVERNSPSVEMLLNSSRHHLRVSRTLDKKRSRVSMKSAFSILINLTIMLNAMLILIIVKGLF